MGLSVSGTSASVTATSTATGTIRDDDTPSSGVTLSVSPFWIAEDGADTTVTVIAALDADALEADVSVTVSVGDTADSATEGTDYQTVNDFVMTIAAGNVADTGSFLLAPTNDSLAEGEETISVSGSATDLEVTGAEVFIVDDEGGGVTGGSSAPTFGDATVANQSYELNKAITPLVLPAATGGVGALTYALSPSLPAGLTFTAGTRTLSGTPTAGQAAITYTYTATGSDAAADSIEFTIAVGCAYSSAVGGLPSGRQLVDDCKTLLASEATLVGTGTALNWDVGTPMNAWTGVRPFPGGVDRLDLANASLAGSIPAELGDLFSLARLSLHSNALTGSIPTELGDFPYLTTLNLSNNALTGSIPAELGDLSHLRFLSLHNNELTGSIPAELGDLSRLTTLNLNNNRLTGCIPLSLRGFASAINPQKGSVSLPVCLGVPVLTLSGGNGQIAAAWTVPVGGTPTGYDVEYKLASDTAWTNAGHTGTDTTATIGSLTNRSAYHVRVRAKTTTDTGDWSAVATGTPSANPPDFGTATVANQSYTPNTAITPLVLPAATGGEGTVTYALSPDPPAGLSFDAATRTLTGTPTRGGSAVYAYTATDADNNVATLTFTIAVTFGCSGTTAVGGPSVTSGGLVDDCEALLASEATLVGTGTALNWDTGTAMTLWIGVILAGGRVTELDVNGAGTIPAELGDLSSLTRLEFSVGSRLSGTIPPELGKLSNLVELVIWSPRLSGPIPAELGNLSNLERLILSIADLTGPIPAELGNLSNLLELFLDHNELTGPIPPELGKLSKLDQLGLDGNWLTGTIPPELGDMSSLRTLYLSGNLLTGPIPPELGKLSQLEALQLGRQRLSHEPDNQLTGTIPPELGRLSKLVELNVGDSQLTGTIPPELGNLSQMDVFFIEKNQLTGTIPSELGSFQLRQVSIGDNWLKGCFPTAWPATSRFTTLRQRDGVTLSRCGVALSVNPVSVAENATATTVTVTATMVDGWASDVERAVRVQVGESSDGATEGTDYTAVADFTVTIPADSTNGTATFTLTPTNDRVEEGGETLSVTGTTAGLSVTGATVTITDDEGPPTVSLALSPSSISENGDSTTVTATLSRPSSEKVTLVVSAAAVSPAMASDFTLSTNDTLTIAAGATTSTRTVRIKAVNNAVDAPDKSVTVSATATGGGVADPVDQALTITDDDATPTVTLVLSADSISENGGSATVTATLSGPSTEAVRLTVSTIAVSPAVAADFTVTGNKTLTIAAGETASTGTVTVSAVNNTVDAPDKAVTVSATVSGGHGVAAPASRTLTIANDDATAVELVLSPSLISENGDSTTVTAALSGPSSEDVTLVVSATAVSPAVAGDFTLSTNDTLTIAAGETTSTRTVRIKAVNNAVDAPDKSVTVSAAASGGNGVSDPSNQTLTITDDDATPTVSLVFSADSIGENGDSTTVTATLSGPSSEKVTLVVSAAAVSPAVASDFTLSTNDTLVIAAGATTSTRTVRIKAVNNAVDAPDKSVTVSATASGGRGVANPADRTLTITDDDATPTVTLVLSADSISENGDSTTVTATLSGVSSADVTLTVAAAAVSPAVAEDFTLSTNDTLTIAAGATTSTRTVRIKAVNNAVDAPDKSVTVSATASGGNGVADPSDQTLTITDDDATPTVTLALNPTSIGENGDSTTVTATLSAASSEEVTLVVSAAAVSPAVASDFALSANDTLTIAAGATTSTRTVRIKAVNNAVDAPDKSVTVSATASGGRGVVAPADQTLTITDDDATPTVTLALSPTSIGENGDSTTVTATLSGPSSESVTLVVSAEAVSPAVAADFTLSANDTLTIAAGATTSTRTVRVKAVNNAVDAPDKSVTVSATASGGRGVVAPADQTLTITDDDATPTVTLVLSPDSIGENGDSTTVTATLSGPSSESVTLVVSAAAVSPAVAADFTLSTNDTLTIAAGATTSTRTVRIKAVNNAVDAPDKSVTVSATATGGRGVSAPSNQTLTITDDDATPTVTLVLSPSSIGEDGDSTTVTATLSGPSSEEVTLVVSAAAVSPAVDSDFTLSTNDTLTIAAGATTSTRTVRIKAVNNAVDAPDKSVTVSATVTGGRGVSAPSNQTLTITDDDATPTVSLVLSPSSISENGDSTTVTATLSGPSSESVTLVVSATAVSPAVASDFTLSANDTLTIAAGATTSTRTVRIKAVNNAVDAPDKSVTVSATVSGGRGVSAPSNKTLTITDDDATPTVSLVLSPDSIGEDGDSTTVTATLSGPSSEEVTLVVSAEAVSPAVASDFTLSTNDTLTIAAGATTSTRTVRIKAVNNAVDAPDKSVTVSATATGGRGVSAPSNQTLTITDDDATPTVNLVLSPSSISENGDSTTVTATLSGPSSEKVTLVVSATAVSPAVASDFTLSTNDTLTIAAGATTSTRTVRIKAVNNAVDAPDKSVTVSATASGGRGVADPSNRTLTITDDDATPTVSLVLSPDSISENGDSTTVTATLSGPSSEKVTLVVSATAVSPAVGTDFALSTNDTLTIAAGATTSTRTVRIKAANNAVDAPDKSVTVSATASGGNGVANPANRTLTITDDDATPTVSLVLSPDSISENGDSTTVTATLSGVSSEKVTLVVSATAVSPAVGSDFTLSTNDTLTIAAGATTSTRTVRIKAVNNAVDAPDKSVTVSATASGGNGVADPSNTTLTITDDDATPTVTLVLSPSSISENGDSTTVTATLSGPSSENVTLVVSATAVSPAVASDFTLSTNDTLTIAAGATTSTRTVRIKAVNNAVDAPDKSVTVSAAVSGGRGVANPSDQTLTISDDDATPTVTLVLSPSSISENGDSTTVTATLSGPSAEKVTLVVSAAAVSPAVGSDFALSTNDTLTIAAGATTSTGTVRIKAVNNAVDAPDKSVTVSAAVSGGRGVSAPSNKTLTITDDDATPTVTLVLSPSSISENGDSTTVTATLSGPSAEKVTLVVSAAAVSPAVGSDFALSTNDTLTIAAGATTSTRTVRIKAVNNAVDAPDKSVTVSATASGGNGVSAPANQTLTISDDEATPTVTLVLSPSSIGENGDSTTVTATLSGPSSEEVTLVVSAAAVSPAVDSDFTLSTNDTLTIAAGATTSTRTVRIKAVNNAVDAPDKSVTVSATASGGRGVSAPADRTLTITDDDATPTATLVLNPDSISENGDSTTVTATLSGVSSEKVTLVVSATAVSPAVGSDFTLSTNDTLTIAAGATTSTRTVRIKAVDNAVDAPDKSVTVSATASGGNGVSAPSNQTLTITDDDATPTVTLVLSPDSISENGDSTTVTATLSGVSSEKVTLVVSATAVSPAVAADFTLSTNDTLTIAAGATTSTRTVRIKAVNNAVDAPDKSVTVSATASGGNGVADPSDRTLTITDDDATPTVTLVLSPSSISENGDSTTVTATLSGPSSEEVTLVVSAAAVSPAVASDFTLSANDTLTIAAGATTSTRTVKIKAVNNTVDAPDKSVTVSATASGGRGVSAPSNRTLTITDDDATPTVTLVLSPASIGENGDSTTVTATLSGPSSEKVTLVVSAAAVSPAAAADFTLSTNDTLTIAAGATTSTRTVRIKAVDNTVDAPDKSVTVSATATGGNGVSAPSNQTLTITDDDATPTATLVLSPTSISENGDSTTVTATLSAPSSEKVTLVVSAAAVSPAVAADFTLSTNDTLVIAAGATTSTGTVRIKAVNNAVDAPDKSVTVSATATGGRGVSAPSNQTLTITDDDATPTVTLVLSPDSIGENGDSTTVTATLSGPSSEKVTLVVSATAVSPAVASDFTLSTNDTLTIAAGATTSTRTVRIKAVNNAVDAPDKPVTVSATASGGRGVSAPSNRTLTITDDDATPTVTLVLNPASIGENGDSTTVTATMSGPSSENVTLVVSAVAVSPAVASDFTLSTNDTLTIAAGATTSTRTVRIKAVNNAVDAPDKSVTVSATAMGGRGVSAPSDQTLTITDDDGTPTVTLVLSPDSIGENGDSTTVTATLSGPSTEKVTLVVSATAVSPAVASDFTLSANDTLTIAAGATTSTRTVRIKAVNNAVDAPDKSVTVSATASGGRGVSAPSDRTLTITDDDATPTVTLVLSPDSISENGDSTTVTATLSGVSSEKVTLVVSATAVSPAVSSDFTLSANDTLTIAAGATTSTRTVRIKAVNNAVDAPDKSVTVSAAASGGNGVADPADQTLTITDDDATPTVSLVLSADSISENGDSTTVTATLSGVSSEKVTLVVSATAVSPAVASDFALSTNDTLTIAAGATTSTRTVRIKAVNNAVDAPDKSVTVSATASGGNGVTDPSDRTLTITDDDATPTVSLVLSPGSISENGDSTTVTATLSGPSTEKVTLVVSATAVSPAVAGDFTLSTNDTLTIAAGATTSTRTVRIKAANNAVDAPDKSVTVSATASGGRGVSAPSNRTLTITDDDGTPTVSLVLSPDSISENGDSTTVTATLSGPSTEKVTLVVSAAAVSPAAASDFTLSSNDTLTIAAGATTSTRTVKIKAVNNAVDAPDKSVTVSATVSGGNGVSAPSDQTLTITDDEATPTVSLVLSPDSISENGDSTTVTATLSGPSTEKVTLVVSAAAVSPTVAEDFTLSTNDTLTIAAGATTSTRTVRIKAVNNAVDAPDKSVTVSAAASGGRGVSAPSDRTLTITDDEATPTVTLVLSPSSISENGDSTTVTATLSGPSTEKVTLVVSATAVSPAVGSDFTLSTNDTLTIAAGATTSTRTVRIKAVNNAADAPDKSVTVSATASGGRGVSAPSNRTLTITDDDGTPTVSSPDSIAENGDSTTVTATLSGVSTEKVAGGVHDGGLAGGGLRLHTEHERHADDRGGCDDEHPDGEDQGGQQRRRRPGQGGDRVGHGLGRSRGVRAVQPDGSPTTTPRRR